MKISLVIPCYNEADNVAEFHRIATETFASSNYEYEFTFINDGSKDNTLNILKELYEKDTKHVNVVSFSRNFGKESAIYADLTMSRVTTLQSLMQICSNVQNWSSICYKF